MKIEHKSSEDIKKEILRITGKYLDIKKYKIFFFGSRVDGKSTERSDIDVGIEGDKPVSIGIMGKIEDDIENINTMYTIDIVDFKKVSSDFYDVAKQKIELIN